MNCKNIYKLLSPLFTMGKKGIWAAGVIIIFLILAVSVSASDPVALNARINEAQKALNAPGVDIASAFQTDFNDYIDPATGSLTISQTAQ